MKYALLASILFIFWFSTSVIADNAHTYLLGKYKLKGTTYTQIVFFEEKEVQGKEACDKERIYGRRGAWRYYNHMINKSRHFSAHVNYFCLVTPISFGVWNDYAEYEYIYLVDIKDSELNIKEINSYSACLKEMRKTQAKESHTYFCARSNQKSSANS